MNWKLIFLLSLFGLAMGIATVYVIPSRLEPMFWLAISILCVTLSCSLVAAFFHLTEQPRQVEVQDRPSSGPHVIHMTGKQ